MVEVITPDHDLSLVADGSEELFWATDEVKAVCAEQFDDETVAEWKAMTPEEQASFIER